MMIPTISRCRRGIPPGVRRIVAPCLALMLLVACATHSPNATPKSEIVSVGESAAVPAISAIEERAEPVQVSALPENDKPIPLSRDGALLTAIRNNASIEIAQFGPQIAQTYISEARAAFDPVLLSTISIGHDTRQLPPVSAATSNQTISRGSAGTAPEPDTPLEQFQQSIQFTQRLLDDLQGLRSFYDDRDRAHTRTDSADGTMTLMENLPTGTQIFLTGAASHVDTNRTSDDYQGAWVLGVNQALLRGGNLGANLVEIKKAKNSAERSEHAFRRQILDTAAQVELAYWDLVLANEVLKIRQFAVTLADEQLKRNQDLFSVGKIVEGDVMSADAEKSSRLADLADAQAAIRGKTLLLIRLLNPDAVKPWEIQFDPMDAPVVAQVELNADMSEQVALQYRPEIQESRLELANAKLDLDRARNNLLPRLDLVASYGRTSRGAFSGDMTTHLDSSDYDNYRIGVEFETPLMYRAERARHHRAKSIQAQAGAAVAGIEQVVSEQVRQAIVEVDRQWQRISATQSAVKGRSEELRIAQDRNSVGKATNLDVQIVQRNLIQAEVDEVTSRVRYIESLTSLYAAEGALLERRGIAIDGEKSE